MCVVVVGGIIPDEDAAELKEAWRGGGVPARRAARRHHSFHPRFGKTGCLRVSQAQMIRYARSWTLAHNGRKRNQCKTD